MASKKDKSFTTRIIYIYIFSFLVEFSGEGKWLRNIDYYRLDGSTTAQSRKKWAEEFNDETNVR